MSLLADCAKARTDLDWEPKVDWRDGMSSVRRLVFRGAGSRRCPRHAECGCRIVKMSRLDIAIIVNRLGEHWLGGVNYYRNTVEVFDAAADCGFRLHVLTDDAGFLQGIRLSSRVVVHQLPMLQRKSASWAVRSNAARRLGKDLQLVSALQRLKIGAVFLKYVAGAREAGIFNYPWIHDFQSVPSGTFRAGTGKGGEEKCTYLCAMRRRIDPEQSGCLRGRGKALRRAAQQPACVEICAEVGLGCVAVDGFA